jgi:hypothetical protein
MKDVWKSTFRLALAMRSSSPCEALRTALNPSIENRTPIQRALNSLFSGAFYLEQQPLLLSLHLQHYPEGVSTIQEADGGPEFLKSISSTPAWGMIIAERLREMIPGYPEILAPHIAALPPGWSSAEPELVGMPWQPHSDSDHLVMEEQVRYFLRRDYPENSEELLESIQTLQHSFSRSTQVGSFSEAIASLLQDDLSALDDSRRSIARLTAPQVVHGEVGPTWSAAIAYRNEILRESLVDLTGAALLYCEEFVGVDRLLQNVMMLLGAIVVDADEDALPGYRDLTWRPEARSLVLTLPKVFPIVRRGSLLLINEERLSLTGVAVVKGVGIGTADTRIRAEVLEDSEELFGLFRSDRKQRCDVE